MHDNWYNSPARKDTIWMMLRRSLFNIYIWLRDRDDLVLFLTHLYSKTTFILILVFLEVGNGRFIHSTILLHNWHLDIVTHHVPTLQGCIQFLRRQNSWKFRRWEMENRRIEILIPILIHTASKSQILKQCISHFSPQNLG